MDLIEDAEGRIFDVSERGLIFATILCHFGEVSFDFVLDAEHLFVHVALIGLAKGQSICQSACINASLLTMTDFIIAIIIHVHRMSESHLRYLKSPFIFITYLHAYSLLLIVSEEKKGVVGNRVYNAMKQTSNLHKVIDCLQQQERMGLPRAQTGQDIEQIHNVTIGLLNSFGEQVERCKKYNEARIHRKYENTILILQQQNITLQRALQLERQAVPSSLAYVSDLIDRMVELRNTNDRLRQQNQALQQQISLYEARQDPPAKQWETATQSQLSNESMLVRDAIGKYTRWRRQEPCRKEDLNLLRFLQFNSSKASKWTLFQLFQRLQKWMANMKDVRFLDSQRIRQNLERTHSSIEQSQPTLAVEKTMRADDSSRLEKLKTENLGSFVNSRLTMVRKKPGQALHASLVRRELASTALSKSEKKQRRT